MKDFLYTPYDFAIIINKYSIKIVRSMEMLSEIFRKDNAFIAREYRDSEKKFVHAVMDMVHYINNREVFDEEISALNSDFESLGLESNQECCDFYTSNFFFKELRIKILYINKQGYSKMKLRTILKSLGYQRRSQNILRYIGDCLMFYHMEVTDSEDYFCDIEAADIDEMLVFRVI